MLRARLKVTGGKHRGKTISLTEAKFLIGREQDCQLRPTSELISRHHCAITVDDFTVRLRDLGSTNGTFVNEQRVQGQVTLKSGDQVRVGKLQFEVLITELSAEEASKLASSGSATALADILADRAGADTPQLSGSETAHELRLPLVSAKSDSALNQTFAGDSSTFELNLTPAPPTTSGRDSAMRTPVPEAETSVASHQSLVPAGASYGLQPQHPAPMYQPPGQYAPMGGYAPMPQYPQMPMGYPPQAAYGYPQPGMYAPPLYPMPQPPAMYPQQHLGVTMPEMPLEDEKPNARTAESFPLVVLPDPSQTGAKPPAPPKDPAQPAADGAAPKKNPSQEAADIIKQQRHRRPGT